jgi:hypothetical protein
VLQGRRAADAGSSKVQAFSPGSLQPRRPAGRRRLAGRSGRVGAFPEATALRRPRGMGLGSVRGSASCRPPRTVCGEPTGWAYAPSGAACRAPLP